MKRINEVKRVGRTITYEIVEDGVVILTNTKTVPDGFDRLLIPQAGGPALTINL